MLNAENLRCVRPGFGMEPRCMNSVLGMRILRDAPAGTPLSWDLLKV